MRAVAIQEPDLSRLVQNFFVDRLVQQRSVSPCTVASYRDAFRLLLTFAASRLRKTPVALALPDLDVSLVLAFLEHLEVERGNSVSTRNSRLTAIRSFMHYASHRAPTALTTIRNVLAIPSKRGERRAVDHLSRKEVRGLLGAADTSTWSGHRDRVLFQVLYNTGARVSEVTGMDVADLDLGDHPQVRIHGKGRKERVVPLWRETKTDLRRWLPQIRVRPQGPVFPNRNGERITRSGVASRLRRLAEKASVEHPELRRHHVSPHLIRHTTAIHLLQSGVDLSVIAMWLGHESIETTHQYMAADLRMKEAALDRVGDPKAKRGRFRAPRCFQWVTAGRSNRSRPAIR